MSKYVIKIGTDTDPIFPAKGGVYPDNSDDVLSINTYDTENDAKAFLDKLKFDYNDPENEIYIIPASELIKLTDNGIEFDGVNVHPVDPAWETRAIQIFDHFGVDINKD